ncbi:MAG TPA: alkaline phosphatase family protein [Thermoanaerobaculia bacterium]|jgi:phospholipase C|nr:alkaline phosphatase family protein [Thermoanaerobaculia bacterium]
MKAFTSGATNVVETSNIYIVNNLTNPLSVSTSPLPSLNSDYWGQDATTVPQANGQGTQVTWFSRNRGITNDETWTFTTSFTLDGVQVNLQEQVTGTRTGSNMLQNMTGGGSSSGWWDSGSKSITFTGNSGAVYNLSAVQSSAGYQNVTYTISMTSPGWTAIPPVMTQITTIVMLMLENRSLDTVLGWLYQGGKPAFVFPPNSSPTFDGIQPGMSNSWQTTAYSPQSGTDNYSQPCRTPQFDPYEPMPDVLKQLYADANGNLPDSSYIWGLTPPMTGFAWDYYAPYVDQPGQVMGAYSASDLPVFYGLAQSFAVSDRWFSSVPTQTYPNRAFSLCGTSLGCEVNSEVDGNTFANTQTVFNALGKAGKTWGLYWQTERPAASGVPVGTDMPYTQYYFSMLDAAQNGAVYPIGDFKTALENGTLPNFCYLEPYWGGGVGDRLNNDDWIGIQGNDYHPPAWVGPAEADLNELYNALINSPQWPNMLFIITFDEHGGTWDHVPPTTTVPPDGNVGASGFQFNRLGVRVPTLLVSPYIQSGTVFRSPDPQSDFDHTSFIATFLKWAGIDPASPGLGLGARVAVAPTFEGVLSTTPRTDKPAFTVPPDYATQGGGVGAINYGMINHGSGLVDVREFRRALDNSLTPEEFRVRLQAMMLRAGKETPRDVDPEKPRE